MHRSFHGQWCFNPLPSPKQGETMSTTALIGSAAVSIRSPHRSKGRHVMLAAVKRMSTSFNPLPSPKQGETDTDDRQVPLTSVSIRSPHRSKGRLPSGTEELDSYQVSIRSPHRSKGRRLARVSRVSPASFQSAPLTEARGDSFAHLVVGP